MNRHQSYWNASNRKKRRRQLKNGASNETGRIQQSRNCYLYDVAEKTNMQAEYIKTRGLKDDHFKTLILEYLDKYKQASKEDIDKLLLDILPGVLDENQRKNKIHNLIYGMSKRDKTIINRGTNRYPKWVRIS